MAKCYEKKFKDELDMLMKLKVIKKLHRSDAQGNFSFSVFVAPKKNTEELRHTSGFRELNEHAQRSQHSVPLIRDTIKMEGFPSHVSMGHWHVSSHIDSQLKCVVIT